MGDAGRPHTVLDATVLSNFAYIDRVDLLEMAPGVCTVPGVRRELEDGTDPYRYLRNAVDSLEEGIPVVGLDDGESSRATGFSERLDRGESEVIAVAESRGGTVATDDGLARSIARDVGVPLTGSIGILVASVEKGRVDMETADGWLKQWVEETAYRAPSSDISDYL